MLILSVIFFMVLMASALFIIFILGFFKTDSHAVKKIFPLAFSADSPLYIFFSGLFLPVLLVAGAWALYYSWRWALLLALLSLVTLIYSSLKSFVWGGAGAGIRVSEVIQLAGFVGGAISIITLIMNFQ